MITVKLYGLLRLDTGIRELSLDAKTVPELYSRLLNIQTGLPRQIWKAASFWSTER